MRVRRSGESAAKLARIETPGSAQLSVAAVRRFVVCCILVCLRPSGACARRRVCEMYASQLDSHSFHLTCAWLPKQHELDTRRRTEQRTRPETKRNPKTESVKYGGTISRTIISRRRSGPTPARRAVAPPPAAAVAVGGLGYTLGSRCGVGPARGRPFNWRPGVCTFDFS